VIGVAIDSSSASGFLSTISLQSPFEAAILGFIFGPPEIEETAWKKIREIIEFASKYKPLGKSDQKESD